MAYTSIPAIHSAESGKCSDGDEYFTTGKTYKYLYNVNHIGKSVGSTPKSRGIRINCHVQLNTDGHCHYTLSTQDGCYLFSLHSDEGHSEEVISHPKSEEFNEQMKRYSVSFTLINGTVWNVSAHENENIRDLNVKRGIISAFITGQRPLSGNQEMRTDVQGTCPTRYQSANGNIYMNKHMEDCHFPKKSDWLYSPLSLFWNMSFIQTFWINSKSNCQYKFKDPDNKELLSTSCEENHAILLESTQDAEISVQTAIKQTLSFLSVGPLMPINDDITKYRRTSILYEYDRITNPISNPPNFEKKVVALMESLIVDIKLPIEPISTVAFGELIDLLREAADLIEPTKKIPICWKIKKCEAGEHSTKKYTDNQLQFGQIWRDALFQCNRLPCYRAIRALLTLDHDYVENVLSEQYLNFMAFAWTNIQITNIDVIQEIFEICKLSPQSRCINSLSSIVYKYWTEHKAELRNKIPTTIHDIVRFVTPPIIFNCSISTGLYDTDHVVKALQLISNLGEVVEMVHPDIMENIYACCVTYRNYEYLSVKALAIQATERLKPSNSLHDHLWLILRDPKLQLEEHALAYLMLAKKFGDAKFVDGISELLNSKSTDYHLKTFMRTHLKSVLKERDPRNAKLIQGIRNKISPQHFDLNVENDYVSQHWQYNLLHETPFLRESKFRDSINRFGFQMALDYFYNNGSFTTPSSVQWKNRLYLFSKEVDLLDIFANLKKWEGDLLKDESELKFPYKVNEDILNNLVKLHHQWSSALPNKYLINEDSIVSLKFLGEVLGYFSYPNINLSKMKIMEIDHEHNPISSKYWKVVEAFNLVPTMSGLPLNWTTNAYFFFNNKHISLWEKPSEININALATLRNRMNVDLPGFTDYGIQSFSTISTAVGSKIKLAFDLFKKKFSVAWEVPQRPMQLLSLTRQNYIIDDYKLEEIPDWNVDRVTEDWCSERLVPYLGAKVCHSKSYPNVTHRKDKPWTLMAGHSHWKYELDYITKRRIAYELNLNLDQLKSNSQLVSEATLKIIDPVDEFPYAVEYSFTNNEKNNDFDIKLSVSPAPYFNLTATGRELEPGYQFVAEASTDPGKSYKLTYLSKKTHLQKDKATMSNRLSKSSSKELVDVVLSEQAINISTPENFYTWNYQHQHLKQMDLYDHIFSYKSTKEPWLRNVLEDIFWEDEQTAWVELHRETYPSHGKAEHSYNYLKIPKSIIQLHAFHDSISTTQSTTYFNLTKNYLPSNQLVTFFNFSHSGQTKKENGTEWGSEKTNFSVPWFSLAFDNKYKAVEKRDEKRIEWVFRTESLNWKSAVQSSSQKQLTWWVANTPDIFYSKITTVKFEAESKHEGSTEISANVTFSQTSGDRPPKDWRAIFRLSPNIDSKQSIDYNLSLEVPSKFLWNALLKSERSSLSCNSTLLRFTSGENAQKTTQKLWLFFGSHPYILSFTTEPNIYQFETRLDTFWDEKLLELNITAHSPLWSLLDVDLRQTLYKHNETMKMIHQLVDIDVTADWKDGSYHKKFQFKSKDTNLIPNMVWKIDFQNEYNGTLQFTFLDSMTHVYVLFERTNSEWVFTVCYQTKCRDLKRDPNSFVLQRILALDDTQHLTVIGINNYELSFKLYTDLLQIFAKAYVTWLETYRHKAPFLEWTYDIDDTIRSMLHHTAYDILRPIINAATPIIKPTAAIPINFGKYLAQSLASQNTYIGWFFNYFHLHQNIPQWTMLLTAKLQTEIYNVQQFLLPVTLNGLRMNANDWNPAFFRWFRDLFQDFWTAPPFRSIFHDDEYDRFALFLGNGDVYTFEGNYKPLGREMQPGCAQLLSQDVALKNFTIFYQDSRLHFLFRSFKLTLSKDGRTFVNDSRHDLPVESWNSEVQVSRTENIVELKTKYDLKVICDVQHFFCLFYTNKKKKFNLLRGALGNNNDIREGGFPAFQDILSFELSDHKQCKNHKSRDLTRSCRDDPFDCNTWTLKRYNSPTLPCHDIVPLDIVTDSVGVVNETCPAVNAYLAICSAHSSPIGWPPIACLNAACGPLGASWKIHMTLNLEVIFLIDQAKRLRPGSFIKGIEQLADAIHKQFIDEGYNTVKFGLVGFHGRGLLYQPHQYTINGNLLGTSKEFADSCLTMLAINGPVTTDGRLTTRALEYAAKAYALDEKAVHMFILIIPEDPTEETYSALLSDTLRNLERESVTLHTFSNYFGLGSKSKGMYGIRGDGYVFPQPKSSETEVYMTFPKGQFAKLTSATRGAVWQLSYLEGGSPEKPYLYSIADEMIAKGRQDLRKCKICECTAPVFYQPKISCKIVQC